MRVECHAGHRADEEPRRIRFEDHTVEVVAIEDRWVSPQERGFRVRGDDGRVYVLRQSTETGAWS